jgi:ribosomal protein S18 acetylase RimI-like enzyme
VESALNEASGRIRLVLDPLGCERWGRTVEDQCSYSPPPEYGIRTLAGYEIRQAEEVVLPLVAASHYAELPEDAGLAAARECLGCLDGSDGGEISPDYWLVSEGRGFALSWVEGEIGFLSLLGVVSDQRRTGMGEALVRSAMALFAQRGSTRMEVSVNPRQPGSMAFYRSLGFTVAECHEYECCSC